ncbi:MAG: cobaltochelatase subunit CobN [Bacteroidales bacterium]|jgi:cobaltochelatase CobN
MKLRFSKFRLSKKTLTVTVAVLLVVLAIIFAYNKYVSPTRIALVNFQPYMATSIQLANTDKFIKYENVPLDKLNKLSSANFVLAFGMGLKMSAEQRVQLQKAIDKGVAVNVVSPTSPDNVICTLDSIQKVTVTGYMNNGGKKNYRSLARYIRTEIDKKKLFVTLPDSVVETPNDVLYHLDEEQAFATVEEYETYLRDQKIFKPDAPTIAMIGGFNDPFSGNRDNIDSIIVSFERAGFNFYPISSTHKRLDFLQEINPDAVIYFAHGRLAMGQSDAAVDWLKSRNIPIFAPLSILQTQDKWEEDKMGMFGGFLSQSIVMPELDGGIYPYVLNVQAIDKQGLYRFKTIPERLKTFTEIVSNYIQLKEKKNSDKKIAIFYFKGPGQSSLSAQGLETPQSLYNLLKRLKAEGYKVDNLPADEKAFENLLISQGAIFSPYAEGAFDDYLKNGKPLLIDKSDYESWAKQSMPAASYEEVVTQYGDAPGSYMAVNKNEKQYIAVAAIQLENITLLPQPMAGLGGDAFEVVHGAKMPPPHSYIAPYLWAQHGFKADAMVHFGTHGSLEFTPQKQVALSNYDWSDILVGSVPHFYYYTIGNIGESVMAKRRSYATLISYITPAFSETKTRTQYKAFTEAVNAYYKADPIVKDKASLRVKKVAVEMGLHRFLRLDSVLSKPYSEEDIERLENFAEEIANEKMTGTFYTTGVPYSPEKIKSTVMAMSADPIAYSLAALDRQNGKVTEKQLNNKVYFTQRYLNPAKGIVNQILGGAKVDSNYVAMIAGISTDEIAKSKLILTPPQRNMMAMMTAANATSKTSGAEKSEHPSWIPKTGNRPKSSMDNVGENTKNSKEYSANNEKKQQVQESSGATSKTFTEEEKNRARPIVEIERTITNVLTYKTALLQSPEMELQAFLNALSGGYTAPSSGGDAIANPHAVPTGKNIYSINAEATPSEVAWDKGVALAEATIEQYRKQHNGEYPRKVSYTFWSSEFIESEGATIAQTLYMLGVEPIRDAFGRVSDLRLIPTEQLGRPRIDVVIQTSGQFRDIAASRLALISRAVEMASNADDDKTDNFVKNSTIEIERQLVEQGLSPKNARELSKRRVFGGINGMYGTGIQEMITSSDRWENEKEITDVYLNNMGASYADDSSWGEFDKDLLRAVLHNTDAIVQPRQSNTWGALSLDHVYEFMGGMNLTIRNITGKDPDAFFADYRNRNNVRMQELKEAIGVEANSTIFNPEFVKEIVKGGSSSAGRIEEIVTNTFGWNVSKPDVIDNEMWDEIYNVFVKDTYNVGTQTFFERENPASLQEITAVMMESARKEMWKASEQQLKDIAELHAQLVNKYGASGKGFSGGNKKLQEFIATKTNAQTASQYKQALSKMEKSIAAPADNKGIVLRKNDLSTQQEANNMLLNGGIVVSVVLATFIILVLFVRKRRKNS